MARLLDDLLDVSRVTQGKVTLKTEELALAVVIESAMETVGCGQEEDLQKSHEAGFDHHLVKPVTIEALRRLLQGL